MRQVIDIWPSDADRVVLFTSSQWIDVTGKSVLPDHGITDLYRRLPHALQQQLDPNEPTLLRLHRDLPAIWHDVSWEQQLWAGSAVFGRLLIQRCARLMSDTDDTLPWPSLPPILVLNLWPINEPQQPSPANWHYPNLDIETPIAGISLPLEMDRYGVLVILAHGTGEATGELRDRAGGCWLPTVEQRVPPLVIVVACGDRSQKLSRVAQRWFDCGAQSVMIAREAINASQAFAWVKTFLTAWGDQQQPLPELLIQQQQDRSAQGEGAQRLVLLGCGDLRRQPPTPITASERIAQQAQQLTQRFHFEQTQHQVRPTACKEALLKAIHYESSDEGARRQLVATLVASLNTLSSSLLTLSWLLPLTIYLAERYYQTPLPLLRQQLQRLRQREPSLMAGASNDLDLFRLAYRDGAYQEAVGLLVTSREAESTTEPDSLQRRRIGGLISCFVDLALPEPAEAQLKLLQHKVATHAYDQRDAEERQAMFDREARVTIRNGDVVRAWHAYRRRAATMNGDERLKIYRIYAASLLTAADRQHRLTPSLRTALGLDANTIITSLLEMADELVASPSHRTLYHLRALALWCWREGVDAALPALSRAVDAALSVVERLDDKGPLAQAIGYRLMACGNRASEVWLWREAQAYCDDGHYYLEAWLLAQYAGDRALAQQRLMLFQQQRRQVMALLEREAPDWVTGIADYRQQREALEQQLCQEGADFERCLSAGLVIL